MKRIFYIVTAPLRWLFAPFRWAAGRWRAINKFFTEVPPDEPLAETIARPFQGGPARSLFWQGLLENLNDLRRHLFRAVVALLITAVFSFLYAEKLMALLAVPVNADSQTELFNLVGRPLPEVVNRLLALGAAGVAEMQIIELTEGISVFMRVALLAGLVLAMPWIVWEIYLFIAPGLMPPTRIKLLLTIPLVSVLFLLGITFAYVVMLPVAVPFLQTFGGFKAALRPFKYFEFVTGLMFWMGITFQMPVIIYALAAIGWVRARQLIDQWRIAIIVIAVLAAMITPTVDPLNMGLVMAPMILLYGFSILGARIAESARVKPKAKPS